MAPFPRPPSPRLREEGESGFKDLLWKLAEAHVQIRLGPTSKSHNPPIRRKAARGPHDWRPVQHPAESTPRHDLKSFQEAAPVCRTDAAKFGPLLGRGM